MTNVLDSRVLVLNKSYIPINVLPLRKAMKKITKGTAEIITVEDGNYCNYDISSWSEISALKVELEDLGKYDEIIGNGIGASFLIPRVIRVLTYNRINKYHVHLNRTNILARDKNVCQYCGKKLPTEKLNIDHVFPRKRGGEGTWENLVCSCIKCNQKKGCRTPEEAGMKLRRQPVKPASTTQLKITVGHKKYKTWENFVSHLYWTTPLEK